MIKLLDWFKGIDLGWQITLVIGIVLVVSLLIYAITKYRSFKETAYKFVVLAEYYITGTKKGQERFNYVIRTIYNYVPSSLRFIFTEKRIKNIIEWAVSKMKKALGNGINVFDNIEFKIGEWGSDENGNEVKDVTKPKSDISLDKNKEETSKK